MSASVTADIYRKRNIKLGEEGLERTQSHPVTSAQVNMQYHGNKKHTVQAHYLSIYVLSSVLLKIRNQREIQIIMKKQQETHWHI